MVSVYIGVYIIKIYYILIDRSGRKKPQYRLKLIFDRYPLYDVKVIKNQITYEGSRNKNIFRH